MFCFHHSPNYTDMCVCLTEGSPGPLQVCCAHCGHRGDGCPSHFNQPEVTWGQCSHRRRGNDIHIDIQLLRCQPLPEWLNTDEARALFGPRCYTAWFFSHGSEVRGQNVFLGLNAIRSLVSQSYSSTCVSLRMSHIHRE